MNKKVKLSLVTSFVLISLLIVTAISAFAYTGCSVETLPFERIYSKEMGCDSVDSHIELKSGSISTKISAPMRIEMETSVSAWKSNGELINYKTHSGMISSSSVSFLLIVSEPAHTLHTGIIDAAPGTVGDCKGYHSRQFQPVN